MKIAQNGPMVKILARKMIPAAVAVLSFVFANASFAQTAQGIACGGLANGYGPYDYRVQRGIPLSTVENAHFTPEVENLISGKSSWIGGDIGYTLHAFPNHHRALIAMERLGEKQKTNTPQGARYTVECYFERAVRYKPNDTIARGLYAQYLMRKGRKGEAIEQLDTAATYAKENPFSAYNIGLIYFDAGAYDKALVQAHLALEMGFPRNELMEQLKKINKWQEPSAATPAQPTSSSPQASEPPPAQAQPQ